MEVSACSSQRCPTQCCKRSFFPPCFRRLALLMDAVPRTVSVIRSVVDEVGRNAPSRRHLIPLNWQWVEPFLKSGPKILCSAHCLVPSVVCQQIFWIPWSWACAYVSGHSKGTSQWLRLVGCVLRLGQGVLQRFLQPYTLNFLINLHRLVGEQ